MTNKTKTNAKLRKLTNSKSRRSIVNKYLKKFLPEMIYRTMRLENEPVSRKMVSSLIK